MLIQILIRRTIGCLLGPPLEWFISTWSVDDPWKRMTIPAGPNFKLRDFRWYLEGDSMVSIASIEDVCAWLRQCEYADYDATFSERTWKHPRNFEFLRRGDSLDHALWSWQQLVRLGVDAEFVCGRWNGQSFEAREHAWVVFRDARGIEHVLESAAKVDQPMVHVVADVHARYIPHFSVNRGLETVTFHGYTLEVRRRRQERSS